MSFKIVNYTTTGSVASPAGTATIPYPTGTSKGSFSVSDGKHKCIIGQNEFSAPTDFTLTFNANASSITFTNKTGSTIASGTPIVFQMEKRTGNASSNVPDASPDKMFGMPVKFIDLGSPNVADADGVWTSAALTTATCASNAGDTATGRPAGYVAPAGGALVDDDIATFDVPRNVVASWTTSATLSVYGFDEYGVAVSESSGAGTSLTGKKAFKKVVGIKTDTNITGLTVGTGDVFGLPVLLPGTAAAFVLKELQDGAAAVAGTAVAGVTAVATATTGDVRGTYDPNAAADGDKGFALVILCPDPTAKGVAQYAA